MLFEPYSNFHAILAPNAYLYGSSSGSVVDKLLAMQELQETRVQSLGREDPLEKEMAIHSGILAWRIPWTEEPGGLQSTESLRIRHDSAHTHLTLHWLLYHAAVIYHTLLSRFSHVRLCATP